MNPGAFVILAAIESLVIAIFAMLYRRPFLKSLLVGFAVAPVVGYLFMVLGWQQGTPLGAEAAKAAIIFVAVLVFVRKKQRADAAPHAQAAQADAGAVATAPRTAPAQQQYRMTPGPAAPAPNANKKVVEMTPLDEPAASGEAPKS